MSDRSPDRPAVPPDQATRDITLPPLPGRPPPAVPSEWESYVPRPGSAGPGPVADGAAPAPQFDGPTEQVSGRETPHRDPTQPFGAPKGLAFGAPSPPGTPVAERPRRRRGGRVLWALVLLTLAVIIAAGVALVVIVTQR